MRIRARSRATPARSQSMLGSPAVSRFSARAFAASARSRSISAASSAVSASRVTRAGKASAKPRITDGGALARAHHGALVFVGKFFNAQDRDDVLQIFVALQNRLHRARHGVMLLAHDAWVENAREAGQRIDSGINPALHDLPAEVGRSIQVRKRRGRGRIRIIVGGHVNGLHRGDRTGLRRGDALLQFTDFGELQERITSTKTGSITSVQAIYRSEEHTSE